MENAALTSRSLTTLQEHTIIAALPLASTRHAHPDPAIAPRRPNSADALKRHFDLSQLSQRIFVAPGSLASGPAGAADFSRRSIDRQVPTSDRGCAASDLLSSVDTVVVGWQTASLPTLAVSTGEAGSPRPRRASAPLGEYPSNNVECAHRCPPWTCTGVVC